MEKYRYINILGTFIQPIQKIRIHRCYVAVSVTGISHTSLVEDELLDWVTN